MLGTQTGARPLGVSQLVGITFLVSSVQLSLTNKLSLSPRGDSPGSHHVLPHLEAFAMLVLLLVVTFFPPVSTCSPQRPENLY